jgi:hypothetical protein
LFIVGVVAFVAAVPVVYLLLFEYGLSVDSPAHVRPASPQGLAVNPVAIENEIPVALSLTQLVGQVEILRPGAGWQGAEEGMVLNPDDQIRTLPASRAMLSMPGMFTVELESESGIQVKALTDNLSRVSLAEGMITADVVENPDHQFEVTAASATASTRGAKFRMNLSGDGQVAVGSHRGTVDLAAAGKVVRINSGFMARVDRGKTPDDPIRIPGALFLKVRWPRQHDLAIATMTVDGTTDPGARLELEGRVVPVDSRGRFSKVVALREGNNKIKIDSYDVGGNSKSEQSPLFTVDTRPDAFKIQTSPNMWEKKRPRNTP